MRYLAIEIPASPGTWSCHAESVSLTRAQNVYDAALAAADVLVAGDCDSWQAYPVPGDYPDEGAASAAWMAIVSDGVEPMPIARGVYRYDEDGAAPVSLGVEMLTEGGR